MFLLIHFIYAHEYIYNSKGQFTLVASTNDILSFSLQNNERAFIFTSINQKNCFIFPDFIDNSLIPSDFKALCFDNSNFRITVSCNVNISIWIILKHYCHPNSIFVMASYKYTLQIRPDTKKSEYFNEENLFNYCVFSPFHSKEYRKVSFEHRKSEGSAGFFKSLVYSYNVLAPDYETEDQYIETILSNSFFLKTTISTNSTGFDQIITMSFINEKMQDNSFIKVKESGFYSSIYYFTNTYFVQNDNWIDDVTFSFENLKLKKFSWVLIVIILLIMIILLLLCLFVIYFVIKKRNNSQSERSTQEEEPNEECIPDAQSINQFPCELNEENEDQVQSRNKETYNKDIHKDKVDKNDRQTKKINHGDNPYYAFSIVDDNNQEDSESIDPNVSDINPYSLPKA